MKHRFIYSMIIALSLSFIMSGVFNQLQIADAQTGSTINIFQATFTGSEPTFDSPACGADIAYIAISTTFNASGDYAYSDTIYNSSEHFDMEIEVYENSFNPATPNVNYITNADDDETISFTAGVTYIFVVIPQDCVSSIVGTTVFSIIGEGSATNTNTFGVFSGNLSASSPQFTPPSCGTVTGYVLTGPLTVSISGTYLYSDIGYGMTEEDADAIIVDTRIWIYEGAFDPANPSANLIDNFDDGGAVNLTAEISYYFVANDLDCNGDFGQIFFHLSGPGVVSLPTSARALPAPQIGSIQISVAQAQPVYDSAGGEIVRMSGQELWLPQDYDGNGFDTHLVISQMEVDGRLWLEIFIGNGASLVWVPADMVTIVE